MRNYTVGQGATEYLVVLGTVLTISLISISLLGGSLEMTAGMNDEQSKAYWQSTSPIAILDWEARGYYNNISGNAMDIAEAYVHIRNTGSYPIRITKMLAGDQWIDSTAHDELNANVNLSDEYYFSPGEDVYIGNGMPYRLPGIPSKSGWAFRSKGSCNQTYVYLCAASSMCIYPIQKNGYGLVRVENFGFEYVEYVEGKNITKKFIGKSPIIMKCVLHPISG